ncbi:MAG: hypothetical protein RR295_09715 [Oscillospiraceae bacterium]
MSIVDEGLKDSMLTEAGMLKDLQDMSTYYDDMQVSSKILPATELTPMPSMIAMMEEDEQGRARILTHSFVPLDREEAEFTKYIQFYMELQNDIASIDRLSLLESVCRLNTMLPLGHCIIIPPRPELELPEMVGVRTSQGFPGSESVNQGVFTEDVFLFDMSCTFVSDILDVLAEGKTPEAAFAILDR